MLNELETTRKTIIECGIATEEEIELVTSLNGYTIETLDDIVWVRTGFKDLIQYLDNHY